MWLLPTELNSRCSSHQIMPPAFATTEGQFFLDGITDETVKYYMVLRSLPEDLIVDLVDGPLPGAVPYIAKGQAANGPSVV
jgi:hypothetical protein